MLKSILILFTLFITSINYAQSKPKLIVGIVVDQMRYDFLFKYEKKYGNGGFKRLIKEGFQCRNNHFNYVPTVHLHQAMHPSIRALFQPFTASSPIIGMCAMEIK